MFGKRVSLKPVLLLEVTAVILIASIGVAVALNATGALKTGGDYQVELNSGTISDAANLSVTDYDLIYDGTADNVTDVRVYLNNTGAGTEDGNLTVKLGDLGWTTTEEKVVALTDVANGASSTVVTLDSAFAVTSLERIHIYVEQTS